MLYPAGLAFKIVYHTLENTLHFFEGPQGHDVDTSVEYDHPHLLPGLDSLANFFRYDDLKFRGNCYRLHLRCLYRSGYRKTLYGSNGQTAVVE